MGWFTKRQPVEEVKEVIPSGLVNPEAWLSDFYNGTVPGDFSVSSVRALQVPAVASAIKLLADAASTLEVKVVRKNGTATEDVPDHPAAKLLRGDANPWTSGFEIIRALVVEALSNDQGGFAWVNRVDGKPYEILKYGTGAMSASYKSDGSGEPAYTRNGVKVRSEDVIHLRGTLSRCPLTLARKAIGFAASLEDHGGNLFLNGARPGGVIETPAKLGADGVKAMLAGWKAAFSGAANAGKTAVLYEGAKYQQMALSSTDSEYLGNRKFQILEIARAFRVPPGMIYDLDRNTWSNGEQMGKEFLSYSLEPWLRSLEVALGRALLSQEERKTHSIQFERDDLTRADLTARATAYSTLITARAYSPNEVRRWEGLPPYAGGNEFINPAITQAGNDNKPTTEATSAIQ